jgi:hypothetical protein
MCTHATTARGGGRGPPGLRGAPPPGAAGAGERVHLPVRAGRRLQPADRWCLPPPAELFHTLPVGLPPACQAAVATAPPLPPSLGSLWPRHLPSTLHPLRPWSWNPKAQYDIKNDCGEILFTRDQVQAATKELGRKVWLPAPRALDPQPGSVPLPPTSRAPLPCSRCGPRLNVCPNPQPPTPVPQIASDYADKSPLIVPILKGSFIFAADLVRRGGGTGGREGAIFSAIHCSQHAMRRILFQCHPL